MAEEKTSGKKVFHLSPKYLAANGTVYTILRTKLTTELTPAIANTPKLVVFINIKTINVLTAPDNNTNMELSFNLFTTVKTLNKHWIPLVNISPPQVNIDNICNTLASCDGTHKL